MLEPPLGEFEGLPALRRLAAEVGSWPEVAADWQWCARFNYQAIERRGTGGGNFRRMYSGFLGEVGNAQAPVAATAARAWTELAALLLRVSEEEAAVAGSWSAVSAQAGVVLEAEERLGAVLPPSLASFCRIAIESRQGDPVDAAHCCRSSIERPRIRS